MKKRNQNCKNDTPSIEYGHTGIIENRRPRFGRYRKSPKFDHQIELPLKLAVRSKLHRKVVSYQFIIKL
jgi:hypothetical protein